MSREYCMFVLEGGNRRNSLHARPSHQLRLPTSGLRRPRPDVPSTASGRTTTRDSMPGSMAAIRSRCGQGPVPVTVPYGGGFAIPAFTVSDKQMMEGTYKTKLYAGAFTQMLLQLACQQVNTAGLCRTSQRQLWDWQYGPAAGVTGYSTGTCPVFRSSMRSRRSDGTYKHRLYYGVRVKSWQIHAAARIQHDR